MLADCHAGVEVCVEASAGSHAAFQRFDRNPIALANPARLRRRGMQLHFWVPSALAQAGQTAMLALAKHCRLRIGQDQRKARREVRPRHRADLWLLEVRQRRVAVFEERFRVEFNLARRRSESAGIALRIELGVFGVARLQRYAQAAGGGAQLLQSNAGGAKLGAIGGLDVAVPELSAETEAAGEVEDEIGIRARFPGRWHDRLPELNSATAPPR